MPAYSFKAQFAEPIIAGTKGGTIRAPRKASNRGIHSTARQAATGGHAYPGEALHLYTGMRTRQCRKIGERTCVAVEPIILGIRDGFVIRGTDRIDDTANRKATTDLAGLHAFAQFDGFEDWPGLAAFWRSTHGADVDTFTGWHIRWLPLPEGIS